MTWRTPWWSELRGGPALVLLLWASLAGRSGWAAVELRELAAPPLVLHHAAGQEALASALAVRAPRDLGRIAAALGIPLPERLDVHLAPRGGAATPADWGLPEGPEWASGFALSGRPVVVLRTAELSALSGNEAATVLAHEMAHAVIGQALGPREALLPAWMREGLAAHLALEWRLAEDVSSLRFALGRGWLPLAAIAGGFPADDHGRQLAYLQSFAFVNWLVERAGPASLRTLVREVGSGRTFDEAFVLAFGLPVAPLEQDFRRDFVRRYRWIPLITSSTTTWLALTLLLVIGGWRKRRRAALQVAAWEAEEAAESAAAQAAALAPAQGPQPSAGDGPPQ